MSIIYKKKKIKKHIQTACGASEMLKWNTYLCIFKCPISQCIDNQEWIENSLICRVIVITRAQYLFFLNERKNSVRNYYEHPPIKDIDAQKVYLLFVVPFECLGQFEIELFF